MPGWRDCTLGDLVQVKHGFAFLGQYFADHGTHVVLTPGNFAERGGFRAKGDKEKWYAGPIPEEYVLRRGDVLVAMTEQAEGLLGSSAVVPKDNLYLHNQRLGLVETRGPEVVDLNFIYHLFNSREVRQQIRGAATGTKVRHTSPSRIAAVRVRVPDIREQRRIAGILSSYDDLIENCERRIRVLDELARALYREWFVNFRYPGHEQVPLVDSPLGRIPKGWAVRSVKDVATVTYGFPFKSALFSSEPMGVPVVRIRDVLAGDSSTYTTEIADPRYELKDGDILIGMDGDFHTAVWSSGRAYQNQRVARFEPMTAWTTLHLLLALEEPIARLNKSIVGTTVAHLGDMHIRDIRVVAPVANVLGSSESVFEPICAHAITLKQSIRNLRKTRDLLLPRLLSGQLSVDVESAA
jgi:type I restriction enzyme S subunit